MEKGRYSPKDKNGIGSSQMTYRVDPPDPFLLFLDSIKLKIPRPEKYHTHGIPKIPILIFVNLEKLKTLLGNFKGKPRKTSRAQATRKSP
jgi:hypothetical protein